MNDLFIDFKENSNRVVCVVKGDIDAYHSADLKKSIKEKLASMTQGRLVIDMSGVSYVDSAGLGTIVAILKECRLLGKHLVLASLKSNVKRIFEMTRLDMVFKIVDTVEES